MTASQWQQAFMSGEKDALLENLYHTTDPARFLHVLEEFEDAFGEGEVRFVSAPGRAELCGNHTDHQHGVVMALAVHLDIIGAIRPREDHIVRLYSEGAQPCVVDLEGEVPEKGTSDALIFGVAQKLREYGYIVGGFDAYTHSTVPVGSGLSSSAAFENFVATVWDVLYNQTTMTPLEKALAGQWAENTYFGKPCGLMDQLASCRGGVSYMDFGNPKNPACESFSLPLLEMDRVLCVVNTGGSHADLTPLYAAIPTEMQSVAIALHKDYLSDTTKEDVLENLTMLREQCGDRAVIRALNYFDEVDRVKAVAGALRTENNSVALLALNESGMGSQCYLQNVSNPQDSMFDGVGLCLYLSRDMCPIGSFRVHGGGFGGTVLALVPTVAYPDYEAKMNEVFGPNSCTVLHTRAVGGVELVADGNQ